MAQLKRKRWQIVVSVGAGSEAWVIVRHEAGWFRLPFSASVEELMTGVAQGWVSSSRRRIKGEGTVRVPLSQFLERQYGSGATPKSDAAG